MYVVVGLEEPFSSHLKYIFKSILSKALKIITYSLFLSISSCFRSSSCSQPQLARTKAVLESGTVFSTVLTMSASIIVEKANKAVGPEVRWYRGLSNPNLFFTVKLFI